MSQQRIKLGRFPDQQEHGQTTEEIERRDPAHDDRGLERVLWAQVCSLLNHCHIEPPHLLSPSLPTARRPARRGDPELRSTRFRPLLKPCFVSASVAGTSPQ